MRYLATLVFIALSFTVYSQVTITQNEMPYAGDHLYRDRATLNLSLNYAATGPNHTWSFTNLTAAGLDSAIYQTVASTNPVYAILYADVFFNPNRANIARPGVDISFNNLLPVSDPYTFYYRTSSIFKAVGMGSELSGIPTTIAYSDQDEIYNLPLNYGNSDSSTAAYNLNLPTLAYYGYHHKRYNVVDGWGTLQTPLGTYNVLRVKTTLVITDTIFVDTLSAGTVINRPVVKEYKWLAPNYRVPILQINTTTNFGFETISEIFFYDVQRTINIQQPLATTYCPGDTFQLNYNATGMFNSTTGFPGPNVFTAQLSNASGSFTPPVTLGSVSSTTSGTISCTIPANTPPGTGYRIRIYSNNPLFVGADNGVDITVLPRPSATVTASGPLSFCLGDSVTLNAATDPAYTYQWLLNGSNISGATDSSITVNSSGTYTVSVTNTCGTTVSASQNVVVNDIPEHTFNQVDYVSCNGNPVLITPQNVTGQAPLEYQWYLDGILLPGETAESLLASTPGSYNLVVMNPATGCSFTTTSVSVSDSTLNPPQVTLAGNTVFCQGESATLDVVPEPGVSYQWTLDGMAIAGANDTTLTVTGSGIYTVIATHSIGCMIESDPGVQVVVNDLPDAPVISTTGNTTFCAGDSVLLDILDTPGNTYQWTVDGNLIPNAVNSSYIVTSPGGIYAVTVTNGNGCSIESVNSVDVTVYPLPPTPVVTQSNDTLYASGSGSFQWYLDGVAIPGATDPFLVPLVNGNYSVVITDGNGCESLSADYPMTNVGIADHSNSNLPIVYPNPSSGMFFVNGSVKDDVHFRVTDIAGKEITSGKIMIQGTVIDLSGNARGIYILELRNVSGEMKMKLAKY